MKDLKTSEQFNTPGTDNTDTQVPIWGKVVKTITKLQARKAKMRKKNGLQNSKIKKRY